MTVSDARSFGAEALAYVRVWLHDHGRALARWVALRADLDRGCGMALVIEGPHWSLEELVRLGIFVPGAIVLRCRVRGQNH